MQKETRREVGRVAIKTLFLSFFPGLMGCTTSRKETGELRPNITTDELLKPEDRENAVSNRGWTVVDPSLPPDVQLARSQQENRIQPDFYSVRIDGTDTGIGFGRKAAQTRDKTQRTTLVAFTLLQENGIPIWRFFKDNPGKDPSKPQVVLFVNRQNPEVRYYVEIVPNPALYEFYLLESPKEISTNLGKSPEAPQLRMLGRIGVDEMLMSALGWTVGYPALTSHQRLSPQLIVQRIIQVQSGEILVAGQKTGINITQSADGKTQQLRTFVVVTETAGLTARALQNMSTADILEPRIIQLRDPNQREVYFLRIPERVEQSFFPQLFTLT